MYCLASSNNFGCGTTPSYLTSPVIIRFPYDFCTSFKVGRGDPTGETEGLSDTVELEVLVNSGSDVAGGRKVGVDAADDNETSVEGADGNTAGVEGADGNTAGVVGADGNIAGGMERTI